MQAIDLDKALNAASGKPIIPKEACNYEDHFSELTASYSPKGNKHINISIYMYLDSL
jgi:hypothetical protein